LIDSDQSLAIQSLQALKGRGVTVVFICMFTDHYAARSGLPYVLCETIEQLAELTLTTL
jgi:hypothetical protein